MRTRAWWTAVCLVAAAVACGDQPTEVVPERAGGLAGGGTVALATASTDDGLSITTDKDDYAPGDTVWFTGSGWPGDDTLDILLEDEPTTHEPHRWVVQTGPDGTFRDSTYVVDVGDLGVHFTLTATSRTTGRSLTVNFTDGNVRVFGVPASVIFGLTIEQFSGTTTCSGSPSSTTQDTLGPTGPQGTNVGAIQSTESVRLTAAATSLAGGAFINWNASGSAAPYLSINATTICVPGFQSGQRDYVANYTPVPDLRIVKSGPASVAVNGSFTYLLAVSNVGQLATTNGVLVTVSDPLPSGFTLVSAGGSGWSCPLANPVVCTRSNSLNAGSSFSNISIVVTAPSVAVASAANTATVAMAGDLNAANNTSTVSTTVVGTPNLTIDKSHGSDFTRGATEQYTIDVSNVGSGATTQIVTVTDTLPAGLSFVAPSGGTGWNPCTAAGNVVTCQRPLVNAIGPGETVTITLMVAVANGTPPANSITNSARVSGGGEAAVNTAICDLANNCDADPTTVGNANAPPVAVNDDYSVNEDNTLSRNATDGVLGNDTDADGNALTVTVVDAPDNSKTQSFSLSPDGSFSFEPKAEFHGTVTFTYKASDNIAESNVATVTITVDPVNDAPSFVKGADQDVLEDSGPHTATGWATGLSAGPANESGQTLSFTVSNDNAALFAVQPAIDAGTGTLTFTPAPDAFGSTLVTAVLKDNGGTANGGVDEYSQSFTITVKPVNDAPSFTKGDDQEVLEDAGAQTAAGWATAISPGPANESGQTLTFHVTGNTNAALFSSPVTISAVGALSYTPAADANGSAVITIHLQDNGGTADGGVNVSPSVTVTITVKAVNDAPSFDKGGDKTVNEGSGAAGYAAWASGMSAGPADENGQGLDFIVTNDRNDLFAVQPAVDAATGDLTFTPSAGPNGTATVTVKLHDDGGTLDGGVDTSAPQTFTITVNNVAPIIQTLTLPIAPVSVGATVNLAATFTDPGTADVHTAAIDWEDGTSGGSVNEATQSVTGSHVYGSAGIYTVKLTVSDESESDTETFLYVVVYDPSAGFVTGGGWINSPAYACPVFCGGASGKANFGFVSKYLKGATVPTGNTEFQFHAGGLNFSSTLYEWLVVQGGSKASYKGEGTINGDGRYAFLLSAIDNGNSGDRFRIKIWNKVTGDLVYDNQNASDGLADTADPTTTISGGNIVIHTKK